MGDSQPRPVYEGRQCPRCGDYQLGTLDTDSKKMVWWHDEDGRRRDGDQCDLDDLRCQLADLQAKHTHLETVLDQARKQRADLQCELERLREAAEIRTKGHTPGLWKDMSDVHAGWVSGPDGKAVCYICVCPDCAGNRPREERMANRAVVIEAVNRAALAQPEEKPPL